MHVVPSPGSGARCPGGVFAGRKGNAAEQSHRFVTVTRGCPSRGPHAAVLRGGVPTCPPPDGGEDSGSLVTHQPLHSLGNIGVSVLARRWSESPGPSGRNGEQSCVWQTRPPPCWLAPDSRPKAQPCSCRRRVSVPGTSNGFHRAGDDATPFVCTFEDF